MSEELYRDWNPKLTIGSYFAGYLSEGLVRSIVLLLAYYIPVQFPHVSTVQRAIIMALAYLPWHFKYLIGLVMDVTPTFKKNWRRRPFIAIAIILEVIGVLMIIGLRGIGNVWIALLPSLTILMLGDAILDAGMDALLLDVAPPDWHGLGLGTGWGARAIGYTASTLLTLLISLNVGWDLALWLFIPYALVPLPVFLIDEPPEMEERKFKKGAIATTFTDKAVLTWAGMAFLGCIIYTLDPARGFLGEITKSVLKFDGSLSRLEQVNLAWSTIVPFGITTAIASIGMGKAVDKIGHKKGYYISLVGASLSVVPWVIVTFLSNSPQFSVSTTPTLMYGSVIVASIVLGFFSGFCFVAWEAVLADTVPPNFPAFLWQYYMGFLHLMAFLFGPILIIFTTVNVYLGLIFIMITVLMGFIPAKLLKTIKTSKGYE